MNGLAARLLPYALAFSGSVCIMILELVAGRLVARHVGASLVVWTSVIGIMLGGICLGNVLGGRLADRAEPRRVIGPLYALGAALTLGCLWANAYVDRLPGLDSLPWDLRTVLVITLDFLAPGTVLGMISPVVAKWAVDQSKHSGSALGDVYFWGAVGSIAGTFLAGYKLIYWVPTSTIVTVVGAGLALLAAAMLVGSGRLIGLAAGVALAIGSTPLGTRLPSAYALALGPIRVNAIALVGHALALVLGVIGVLRLREAIRPIDAEETSAPGDADGGGVRLGDLATLAFVASLAFMALEMVAGRLVTRHLGSSVYGWTSVIGVLLGGLSLGNLIGGKLADRIRRESQASHLFLVASVLCLWVLLAEGAPTWFASRTGLEGSLLTGANGMKSLGWWARVLVVVAGMFLPPAVALGTISPVVAKLAVDRVRRGKRTGTAIGQVYAWGMVGSILGTFLAGFVLIDALGTKGLLLALATAMALAATWLGTAWHAGWAGLPLGLCLVAFVPVGFLSDRAVDWKLRDPKGDPESLKYDTAFCDESNYYYIRVDNKPQADPDHPNGPPLKLRTLVLDSLIHGHDLLGHPEDLEYDYEFIYAQAADRFVRARAKAGIKGPLRTMFLGGGSYTFPRYLQAVYPGTQADVAEIDPAVTEANHLALGLPRDTPIQTTWGDARQFVQKRQGQVKYDLIFGDAFNDFSVPYHLTTREFNDKLANLLAPDGVYMINIIDLYLSDARARAKEKTQAEARSTGAFLGSWVRTAKRTFPHLYVFGTHDVPGKGSRETFVVVAAKQPLDLAGLGRRDEDPKFLIDRDQFEGFGLRLMPALNDTGDLPTTGSNLIIIAELARKLHFRIFDDEGSMVVDAGEAELAERAPQLDRLRKQLAGLWLRKGLTRGEVGAVLANLTAVAGRYFDRDPYPAADMEALDLRSRGIELTDDYAPVENLLEPVAATRAKE